MHVSRNTLRVVLIAAAVAFSQARGPFSTCSTIAKRSSLKSSQTTSSTQTGMTTSPTSLAVAAATAAMRKPEPLPQPHSATLKTGARDNDNKGTTTPIQGIWRSAKIGFYFALYYALSIYYNIVNKRVLNALPAPLTISVLQFGCGSLVTTLFWKLNIRSPPILVHHRNSSNNNNNNNEKSGSSSLLLFSPLRALGLCSTVGQLSAMVSLGAGPVSFTHIVKAMEPFFSAMVSALLLRQWMHPAVYVTLIPVVGGVGYACLKERSFSWLAFSMAMMSNLCYAFRAVLSKVAMGGDGGGGNNSSSIGSNLTPPNVLGLITLQSFWISIPIALVGEGFGIRQLWSDAIQHRNSVLLVQEMLLSGLVHYFSNEAMFFCLDSVHPVTFSVGNTLKRVCIMVASVLVFHNDITTQAAVGSAIGIAGALLYSLTKQHYEKLESKEALKKKDKTAKKQR